MQPGVAKNITTSPAGGDHSVASWGSHRATRHTHCPYMAANMTHQEAHDCHVHGLEVHAQKVMVRGNVQLEFGILWFEPDHASETCAYCW
jgi:hypothetical protein